MTRLERLVRKICALPPEADADDVIALLQELGWTLDRQRGSHMVFIKSGEELLSIPLVRGRRVKRTYLRKICRMLELDA